MTTSSMIAGMLPLALALDPGVGGETFARHRRHRRTHQLAVAHAHARSVVYHVARSRTAETQSRGGTAQDGRSAALTLESR